MSNNLLAHHKAWAAYHLALAAEHKAGAATAALHPGDAAMVARDVAGREEMAARAVIEHERHLALARQYETMGESEAAE